MTRHGLPAANTASGTSRVTTLPAPITAREPIRTPARIIASPPTHTSDPMSIGLPNSALRRCSASNGFLEVPRLAASHLWRVSNRYLKRGTVRIRQLERHRPELTVRPFWQTYRFRPAFEPGPCFANASRFTTTRPLLTMSSGS